jgi:hypothetical protein
MLGARDEHNQLLEEVQGVVGSVVVAAASCEGQPEDAHMLVLHGLFQLDLSTGRSVWTSTLMVRGPPVLCVGPRVGRACSSAASARWERWQFKRQGHKLAPSCSVLLRPAPSCSQFLRSSRHGVTPKLQRRRC